MIRWQYEYGPGQVHSRGHESYAAARKDALYHCLEGEFTDPTPYEAPDEEGYPAVECIPILADPRVKVEVEYRQYLKVTYPPEMKDEMVARLYEAGFESGGYSGPVHNLMRDYDPNVRQHRQIVFREIKP